MGPNDTQSISAGAGGLGADNQLLRWKLWSEDTGFMKL